MNLVVTSTNVSNSSSVPAWTLASSSSKGSEELPQSSIRFAGNAILNEDLKLVGFLNLEEAKDQMWITEKNYPTATKQYLFHKETAKLV
ncbi:hypothetical protein GCM10020331_013650 [Ectobacillus funiculus]